MRRWSRCFFAVVLVGLLVVPMPTAGQQGDERRGCRPNGEHGQPVTHVPFKAALTGAAHWEFPGASASNCTVATTVTEAKGQATHLGRIVAFWTHCPAEPDNVLDGWVTITAANGDTIIGRYDYDPSSPILSFPISWTGGTGRFADASGSVVGTFAVTPQFIRGCVPDPDPFPCYDFSVPWPWSGTLKGTIAY
jgi:hypothetical protein